MFTSVDRSVNKICTLYKIVVVVVVVVGYRISTIFGWPSIFLWHMPDDATEGVAEHNTVL